MKKKFILLTSIAGVLAAIIFAIVLLTKSDKNLLWLTIIPFVGSFLLQFLYDKFHTITVNNGWRADWKKLKNSEKYPRIYISFAVLGRIKIDNNYLLVLNQRGTEKYQPLGGAYKYYDSADNMLKKFDAIDHEGKIIGLDDRSKRDFRLKVKTSNLNEFVRWFNKGNNRETYTDCFYREFLEEFIKPNSLENVFNKNNLIIQLVGRYESDRLKECKYNPELLELQIHDIVEIKLSPNQEKALKNLQKSNSSSFKFVSEEQINSGKLTMSCDKNIENIADHTRRILESFDDIKKYFMPR